MFVGAINDCSPQGVGTELRSLTVRELQRGDQVARQSLALLDEKRQVHFPLGGLNRRPYVSVIRPADEAAEDGEDDQPFEAAHVRGQVQEKSTQQDPKHDGDEQGERGSPAHDLAVPAYAIKALMELVQLRHTD